MIKVLFLIVCLVAGTTCQSYDPDTDPVLIAIAADLVNYVNTVIQNFLTLLDNGLINLPIPADITLFNQTIAILPGNYSLSAGLLALPTDIVCNFPSPYNVGVCYVGSADCTYVHNKYGGHCGTVANPVNGTSQTGGPVFICNEQNPGYDFTNLPASCGGIFNNTVIDNRIALGTARILRFRYRALQCQYLGGLLLSSTGCASDCRNNHNYNGGTCSTGNTPTATFANETYVGQNCVCTGPVY